MIRTGLWRRELAVPLQSIQAELNRLFEEVWHPASSSASPGRPGDEARSAAQAPGAADPNAGVESSGPVWTPNIDLWEAPGELTLVVDLPGVDPSTIDLSLTGNVLAIRGARRADAIPGATRGRVHERPIGSFYRQVTLVDEVDFDRVEAQARDGVLTVRLPQRSAAPARTIPVQPG